MAAFKVITEVAGAEIKNVVISSKQLQRVAAQLERHGHSNIMAARLNEAKVWESDEVRCESWFDPDKGKLAFLLDLMIAEGELIRAWSDDKKQYAYHEPDIRAGSRLAV